MNKLRCLNCMKILKEVKFFDRNKSCVVEYVCTCGDHREMLFDYVNIKQYNTWSRKKKLQVIEEKIKYNDVFEKVLANNFQLNIKRYNEIMELDDISEYIFELNQLHGNIFGTDIERSIMDYVEDSSELDKGTFVNWKEYWNKRKNNQE